MTKNDYHKLDHNCGSSSSGFVFGLICGAIIGAVIAVIIYKNNKTEVFQKLEQKIKSFFENLIPKSETSSPKTQKSSSSKIVSIKPTSEEVIESTEIIPVFVKPKRSVPKTFIKPKK